MHIEGVRSLLHQLIRNRDPEMQANHLTELRLASALSTVEGRRIELERRGNDRNERRVDFALDDAMGTTLVEVKNLNVPLFKKSRDPMAVRLQERLQGTVMHSDLHLFYLFFRRPHESDLEALAEEVRRAWLQCPRRPNRQQVFFAPSDRPRIGALVAPTRAERGGRVLVYDHGQHLRTEPGVRLRVRHHAQPSRRRPAERLEEMYIKDNVLRRIQDAEQKFPLDPLQGRVVLFCPGPWAPAHHVDRCVAEAVHWYITGTAVPGDTWADYYAHWARRWSFRPLHNLDAIYLLRPSDEGFDGATAVPAGDVSLAIHTVFERGEGLVGRVFFGA